MEEEVKKIEVEVTKEWPALISSVSGITTLIGLFVTLGGGVAWLFHHHQRTQERQAQMVLGQTEAQQGDYPTAVQTYDAILKDEPGYRPALDGQLSAAEQWVENFHVIVPEGQDASPVAGAMVDQIMRILDAGMTRAKGTEVADIQAHIGWAHFLNEKIAEREFGSAAEDNLRAALKQDPNDVYANAMLGNWLLETNGDFDEAMRHFDTAVATGQERPMVRAYELGGLRYLDHKGARAAQVRVANEMRKGGEPLSDDYKSRIVSFCFDFVDERDELREALTAVAPDDEWKTYLWLDDGPESEEHQVMHEFIRASLLEISGDKTGSLAKFRALQAQLKNEPGSLKDQVDAAVRRLQS
ncbi:MAG TPA: tetratricopeptide repeat protein [Terracidiphilus sp.]|nr:tetratricopeptide repeat protein [Terracidiphilus sp.]